MDRRVDSDRRINCIHGHNGEADNSHHPKHIEICDTHKSFELTPEREK